MTGSTAAARRTRPQRLAGPVAVGAVALAGAATLHLRDPHRPGAYGLCPFHALTGLWCPGCGGLRAIHDLTDGDVVASLSSNLFVAPLAFVLVVAWLAWVRRRWRDPATGRPGGADGRMIVLTRPFTTAVLVALAVFTVLRNTPWGAALAPV
ncbi:DUF2752 domain-containing protein [Rhodococcus olei]|uniref:DUF2752 domain-containing protein n=1 Tax=Rhodococcus olei TaxID=2161675 RepID=A0ABP8NVK3_9NOCA